MYKGLNCNVLGRKMSAMEYADNVDVMGKSCEEVGVAEFVGLVEPC